MIEKSLDYCNKDPWEIIEQDVQDYLLMRKNISKWAPSTLKVALCGIRYYYQLIHKVNWEIFKIARFNRGRQLPSVLTREEVEKLLKCVTPFSNYVYLVLVYSCGLRLNEALNIEVSDIDRKRMVIHIHRGKGAKDRYVPLPHNTLKLLGNYWLTHRNKKLMFPRLQNQNGKPVKEYAQETIKMSAPQAAMKKALKRANINRKSVSVHTLRHCYATHLLESGVNLRYIQIYLGHSTIISTLVYLHLTAAGNSDAYGIIDSLMTGF